ncbi:MAG TPA: hypothetical protein V6C71_05315 [Coleofasciculaceae cyanobacterium]|jgi:hypothetical protein
MARNSNFKQFRTASWREIKHGKHLKVGQNDIFDLLANLSLTNLIEGEVIADAYSHIKTDYVLVSDRLNLSDVCALVLNHESVPALYRITIFLWTTVNKRLIFFTRDKKILYYGKKNHPKSV